ncbi:beta-ketoacyl synthase chain length factor [Vibrio sp. 10N]|uniref:beta-ketoacyl synthase chain length factor n=1 Tax=Vibrio sp. 10N TaxID=3058938 RepID=UPI0030C718BC
MDLQIKLAMSQGFTARCTSLDDVYIPSQAPNIPKSILRRSSTLTREVLALSDFIFGSDIDFLVFATKHGELNRTQKLLQSLAHNQELSPTQFAQSVHSTAAGLLTIANSQNVSFTTVCASDDTFAMAMVEAVSHLGSSPGSTVCLVLADEYPPPDLEPFINRDDAGVLAMMLTAGTDFRFSLTSINNNTNSQQTHSNQQQLVDFISNVISKQSADLIANRLNICLVAL